MNSTRCPCRIHVTLRHRLSRKLPKREKRKARTAGTMVGFSTTTVDTATRDEVGHRVRSRIRQCDSGNRYARP